MEILRDPMTWGLLALFFMFVIKVITAYLRKQMQEGGYVVHGDDLSYLVASLRRAGNLSTKFELLSGEDVDITGFGYSITDGVQAPVALRNGVTAAQLAALVHEFGHSYMYSKIWGENFGNIMAIISGVIRHCSLYATLILLLPLSVGFKLGVILFVVVIWLYILLDEALASIMGLRLYRNSGLPSELLSRKGKLMLLLAWLTYFSYSLIILMFGVSYFILGS